MSKIKQQKALNSETVLESRSLTRSLSLFPKKEVLRVILECLKEKEIKWGRWSMVSECLPSKTLRNAF